MDLVFRLPLKIRLTRAYVTSPEAHGVQRLLSEDIISNCQHIVVIFSVIVSRLVHGVKSLREGLYAQSTG
jgi:hypothetical protein